MKVKIEHKILIRMCIVLIILLQIVVYIYWGFQKEGFHGDEIQSFGLASSIDNEFINGVSNGWLDTEEFVYGYLTVSDDEAFEFDIAYTNQSDDVHPPFFYYLLLTVSSFFPYQFSKWFGIGINIVFAIGVNCLVYLIAKKITKNEKIAIASLVFYGFSIVAISMVIFIRMYTILTFFCLLLVYSILLLINYNKYHINRIGFYGILVATFFGFFTHYYYLVFAFFASLVFVWNLYLKVPIKDFLNICLEYIIVLSLGFGINIIVYPSSLYHIFLGYRGKESFVLLLDVSGYFYSILNYVELLSTALFGCLALFLIILGIFVLFIFRKLKNETLSIGSILGVPSIFLGVILCFLTIAIISPFDTYRYMAPLYPIVAILFVIFIENLVSIFIKEKHLKELTTIFVALAFVVSGFIFSQVSYLYNETTDLIELAQNTNIDNAVYIQLECWRLLPYALGLPSHEESIFFEPSDEQNYEYFTEQILEKSDEEELIVYFSTDIDCTVYKNILSEMYSESTLLYEVTYMEIVVYTK